MNSPGDISREELTALQVRVAVLEQLVDRFATIALEAKIESGIAAKATPAATEEDVQGDVQKLNQYPAYEETIPTSGAQTVDPGDAPMAAVSEEAKKKSAARREHYNAMRKAAAGQSEFKQITQVADVIL